MRTSLLITAAGLILGGCAANRAARSVADSPPLTAATDGQTKTTTANAASNIARPLIIDVRSQREWDTGHVENALLIPHTQITERITEVAKDKSKPIYLYCRSGRRSGLAKTALERLGYTRVENVGTLDDARKRLEAKQTNPE